MKKVALEIPAAPQDRGRRSDWQWAVVAAGSALGLVLALVARNAVLPGPALLPVVVFALLGFVSRWTWPPIAVLIWTTLLEIRLEGHPAGVVPNFAETSLYDMAVALFALGYVAAFYRFIFCGETTDPALREAAGKPPIQDATPRIDWLGWASSIVAWPVIAMMLWSLLPADQEAMDYMQLTPDVMLLLAACWLFGGIALVVRAVLAAIDSHTMTASEAKAYLNDLLYCEMRADLQRIASR